MKAFFEFLYLAFWIAPKVFWFSLKEEKKVRSIFYKNPAFKEVDLFFRKTYRFKNPYKISRAYQQEKEPDSLHVYGETPLTVFHEMFERGALKESDSFCDLGCGRGRGAFFASYFWKCQSFAIDQIPFFIEQGKKISDCFPKSHFLLHEINDFDLSLGTFFYFYSLCLKEEDLQKVLFH